MGSVMEGLYQFIAMIVGLVKWLLTILDKIF